MLGQQVEQYSFSHLFRHINNPAAIGTAPAPRAIGIIRQQWVGLSGAPTNQYFSVEAPMGMISGGLGMSIQQSQMGVHKIQKIKLGYSYQKVIGENSFFALGLNGGMYRADYDNQKLRTPGGIYGGIEDHQDVALSAPLIGSSFLIDAGLYSQINNITFGVSVMDALAGKTKLGNTNLQLERHLFGQLGYFLDVSQSIQIKANIQAKWNSGLVQTQTVLLGVWQELYSLGVTMRGYDNKSMESIGGIAGYKLNEHFQLFYSYEYNIQPLRNVFDANHELVLTYVFNKQIGQGKLPKSIYNPRFFEVF